MGIQVDPQPSSDLPSDIHGLFLPHAMCSILRLASHIVGNNTITPLPRPYRQVTEIQKCSTQMHPDSDPSTQNCEKLAPHRSTFLGQRIKPLRLWDIQFRPDPGIHNPIAIGKHKEDEWPFRLVFFGVAAYRSLLICWRPRIKLSKLKTSQNYINTIHTHCL